MTRFELIALAIVVWVLWVRHSFATTSDGAAAPAAAAAGVLPQGTAAGLFVNATTSGGVNTSLVIN